MNTYDITVSPTKEEFDEYTLTNAEFNSQYIAKGDAIELFFDLSKEQLEKDQDEGIIRTIFTPTVLKVLHRSGNNPMLFVCSSVLLKLKP